MGYDGTVEESIPTRSWIAAIDGNYFLFERERDRGDGPLIGGKTNGAF